MGVSVRVVLVDSDDGFVGLLVAIFVFFLLSVQSN